MKKIFSIILCLSLTITVFAQYDEYAISIEVYKSPAILKIVTEKSITYYGWDFRFIKCKDPHFFNPSEEIKKIAAGWIYYIEDKSLGKDYIGKVFKTKQFDYDSKSIQSLIKSIEEVDLINISGKSITIDSVISIVSNYPIKGDGLGLIFIGNEVTKKSNTSSVFATIFDKSSKEVLYINRIDGVAGGSYGLVAYYGLGYLNTVKQFQYEYGKLYRSLSRR